MEGPLDQSGRVRASESDGIYATNDSYYVTLKMSVSTLPNRLFETGFRSISRLPWLAKANLHQL